MITANMVKELREQTGAGMLDCKKALTETNGNIYIWRARNIFCTWNDKVYMDNAIVYSNRGFINFNWFKIEKRQTRI